MKKLTTAEEQVMQILWKIGEGFVNDIMQHFPEPRPAYNTVSTIIRILEKKRFVSHDAFGKSHRYYPVISKEDYTREFYQFFKREYFGNSFGRMVSFFARHEDLSTAELEEILGIIQQSQNEKSV